MRLQHWKQKIQFYCQKQMIDSNLKRRNQESWKEFGSRLAVEELDRFVIAMDPKTSLAV